MLHSTRTFDCRLPYTPPHFVFHLLLSDSDRYPLPNTALLGHPGSEPAEGELENAMRFSQAHLLRRIGELSECFLSKDFLVKALKEDSLLLRSPELYSSASSRGGDLDKYGEGDRKVVPSGGDGAAAAEGAGKNGQESQVRAGSKERAMERIDQLRQLDTARKSIGLDAVESKGSLEQGLNRSWSFVRAGGKDDSQASIVLTFQRREGGSGLFRSREPRNYVTVEWRDEEMEEGMVEMFSGAPSQHLNSHTSATGTVNCRTSSTSSTSMRHSSHSADNGRHDEQDRLGRDRLIMLIQRLATKLLDSFVDNSQQV